MTQAIGALLREPQLRYAMADAARPHIERTCALDRVLEQDLAVLPEVVQ